MAALTDRILGSSSTPDPMRTIALHQALVAALGAQVGPTPSGTLYAIVMAHDYSLEEYEAAIALMVRAGAVKRDGDLLTWCKP